MPKIKFTKAYRVKGTAFQAERNGPGFVPENPDDSPSYAAGQVVEVDDSHARHFVNRGVAVVVGSKAFKAHEAAAPADAKDEAKPAADEPADYEGMTVEELHKIAHDRNLEGRAGLNKADTIKLIEKDDKAAAAKKAGPAGAPKK